MNNQSRAQRPFDNYVVVTGGGGGGGRIGAGKKMGCFRYVQTQSNKNRKGVELAYDRF